MSLDHCRVVLVRPTIAANIGATARVMRNMGLRDLLLVAPEADIYDRQARQLATHGEDILDRARIVADLGEAIGDCVFVAATSADSGCDTPRRARSVSTPGWGSRATSGRSPRSSRSASCSLNEVTPT